MLNRSPLAALALVVLAGCSSSTINATTDEPAADDVTEASTDVSTDVTSANDSGDELVSNTTVPASEPEATTTQAPTTAATTTTTTLPPPPVTLPERDIAPLAAMTPPLEAVGTSNGDATSRAQWRLLELGFWLQDPNGRYDQTTQQAVMAFQKYYGLETDGSLGPVTAAKLSEIDVRPSGASTAGTLVEVDKTKQLVFLVDEGVTRWILNTSTGTEVPYDTVNKNTGEPESGDSVTRPGVFAVDRQREEGWWAGDLGEIYRPKYFDAGIALHGSNYIPSYPASHGCVRLSTAAMDWIWDSDLVPMGTTVWVHGDIPGTPA
ncbi:MAG: murein L,D-transpeptidase [Acidimicrobiaceae bacterium]|nr:murein L,D-transpeptidase [Acidimicrobiaceae bacterium]